MTLQKTFPGHVSLGVKIKRAIWNVVAVVFYSWLLGKAGKPDFVYL